MRFLGVKIGKRVWLNTTDITEFDMVSIGDESMLNEECTANTLVRRPDYESWQCKNRKSDNHQRQKYYSL